MNRFYFKLFGFFCLASLISSSPIATTPGTPPPVIEWYEYEYDEVPNATFWNAYKTLFEWEQVTIDMPINDNHQMANIILYGVGGLVVLVVLLLDGSKVIQECANLRENFNKLKEERVIELKAEELHEEVISGEEKPKTEGTTLKTKNIITSNKTSLKTGTKISTRLSTKSELPEGVEDAVNPGRIPSPASKRRRNKTGSINYGLQDADHI